MKDSALINCLYPNTCAACGEIIKENRTLCEFCSAFIVPIDKNNFCTKCGQIKSDCRCKYREFHFSGIAGVYENCGTARDAYYAYKFSKRAELAGFFALRTADAVKNILGDIEFDAVVSVPTSLASKLKRGFDHSKLIAVRLADILHVPYIPDVLKVKYFKTPQHGSSFSERLENVKGRYYTANRLNAKRVLLFDDIYTTGATLDECAKELMFAGVREVYCAAVLMTTAKKKSDGDCKNGN